MVGNKEVVRRKLWGKNYVNIYFGIAIVSAICLLHIFNKCILSSSKALIHGFITDATL